MPDRSDAPVPPPDADAANDAVAPIAGQPERLRDRHRATEPSPQPERVGGDTTVQVADPWAAYGHQPETESAPAVQPVSTDELPVMDATPVHFVDAGPQRPGTRGFRVRRRLLRGTALVVLACAVYFLVTLAQVWSTGRSDDRDPVDAIVVMGAAQYDGRPSPQLAARLDHVLELWPEGVAPLVVVTGGNIPGDRFTEAEASADYLIERGIPESALLRENAGSNSYESLVAVEVLLAQRGLDEVVIVTDPYHALRSRLIADEVGLRASVSSTRTSVVTGGDAFNRHVKEAGGVAIGRLIGFERLTDLVG